MGKSERKFKLRIIYKFCKCVLNVEKDSPEFCGLVQCDKDFCDEHHRYFNDMEKDINTYTDDARVNNADISIIVKQACDEYCKNKLIHGSNPYSFYRNDFKNSYVKALNEYCREKGYKAEIPRPLRLALDLIALEWIEYENNNLQINNVLDLNLKMSSNELFTDVKNLQSDLKEKNKQIDALKKQIEEFKTRLDEKSQEYKEEIKSSERKMHESNVTILGIFSAVVLTFNASLVFSSSVLESINNANIYKIAFISLVIGFVIFNVLFGLFTFILHIIKSNKKQNLVVFFVTNILIFIMIGLSIFSWSKGFVETRDKKIENKMSQYSALVDGEKESIEDEVITKDDN